MPFWASAPKGTMSCRTQGTFFVRLSICPPTPWPFLHLFVNFPCYSMGIVHFFHCSSIFHSFQWEFCIFPFFFNFPCYSIGILNFSNFSSIFHTTWESYICFIFFVNFPCFSMETIEIFISCQFSMLFNDEMVLSNSIEQKSCVLQDIILLGATALLTITYIHIHTK